jgi:hypothetical protein
MQDRSRISSMYREHQENERGSEKQVIEKEDISESEGIER